MRLWSQFSLWQPLWRRLASGLTLVSYLAAVTGLPVPSLPDKNGGQPFPCQDHACGCRSADQCWNNCCCLSPAERLAWARAHGVQPPQVQAETSAGWQRPRLRDGAGQGKPHAECGCCASTTQEPAAAPSGAEEPSCCREQTTDESSAADTATTSPAGSQWAHGLAALRCQGASNLWISTGSVLPPPPVLDWKPIHLLSAWLNDQDWRTAGLAHQPPSPPPRAILS